MLCVQMHWRWMFMRPMDQLCNRALVPGALHHSTTGGLWLMLRQQVH